MNGGPRSLAIVAGVRLAMAVSARGQTLVTIGGGGSSRTDCLLVLQAPANDPPDRPKKVTCFDGAPSCDHDGIVNGVCEFQALQSRIDSKFELPTEDLSHLLSTSVPRSA